jgi:hypothetical protein
VDDILTDANIVTGLDISDSITADDLWLEVEGIVRALMPERTNVRFLPYVESKPRRGP